MTSKFGSLAWTKEDTYSSNPPVKVNPSITWSKDTGEILISIHTPTIDFEGINEIFNAAVKMLERAKNEHF